METYESIHIKELGKGFCALAYPGGYYNDLVETLVHESGIPVTVSIKNDSINVLVKGLPQSLYALCRMNVTNRTSSADILRYLESI